MERIEAQIRPYEGNFKLQIETEPQWQQRAYGLRFFLTQLPWCEALTEACELPSLYPDSAARYLRVWLKRTTHGWVLEYPVDAGYSYAVSVECPERVCQALNIITQGTLEVPCD